MADGGGVNSINRRLAAIAAADVVGYTRLMEADEVGTLGRFKDILATVIHPMMAEFHGRIFKDTGDGFLAEFPSVVDAIQWATTLQTSVTEKQRAEPADSRLDFRLGVNVGDVIVQDDDLYGDGVNVAARLQTLARPRGICISDDVYRQVRNKLDLPYEDIGEQKVKNVTDPIRAFLVDVESDAARTPSDRQDDRGPSIAVLPFKNLSGDPAQDYFGDGITEDLITALSKVPNLFVLSGHSTFTYKDSARSATQVSRALGADFVIEGSVRRAGDRVRITAQLIEGANGNARWAERYDRTLDDIFAVQDDVTGHIVSALKLQLDQRKAVTKIDPRAYDNVLRARELIGRFDERANRDARELLTEATTLEPAYAAAAAALALTYIREVNQLWIRDTGSALENARHWAQQAVDLDDQLPMALETLGYIMAWTEGLEPALEFISKAIALDPNFADGYASLAEIQCWMGNRDESIRLVEKAMVLNPHYPVWYTSLLAFANYGNQEYEVTAELAARCVARVPEFFGSQLALIAALGQLGRIDDAHKAIANAKKHGSLRSSEEVFLSAPFSDPSEDAHFRTGLRLAGL
jgi:adenylate cyclase